MMDDTDEIKESAKNHSKILAKIGTELSEIQFNFKVLDKTSADYWQKRIEHFKKYHKKGMEYYAEAHLLMSLVEKENAGLFLLSMSKLRQLGAKLIEILEKVKENPTIMSSKDKQQSRWSKELKEELIQYSNKNIQLEKEMNVKFREFYDKHLKKLLE
ncbi:MAG: hypothetical protein COW27_06260 [Nitrosopumilales archaeon CG15_BIG_FIL_POST_REV_8_21_14_020_37_12]|nr:MAG: hypothetical protein COW27_06260 [Nitrosopumilales archaeon CG15_BIG_FIL_POST_REV_8_21_14_020_37_12]